MIAFAFVAANGLPTGGGKGRVLPQGAVALPQGFATEDLGLWWLQGGAWLRRPELPAAVASAAGFKIDGLPDPTAIITVRDLGAGTENSFEAVAPSLLYPLPEDGTFEISVTAPAPWLGSSVTIIRGAGSSAIAARVLQLARDAGVDRINAAIAGVRRRFVTDIPGQEALYLEKRDEAVAYLAATPEPVTLAEYALLASEIGITAPDAYQLAQVWINHAHLFRVVGGLTETLRLAAINAVTAAQNEAAITAALEAFQQSLGAIPAT